MNIEYKLINMLFAQKLGLLEIIKSVLMSFIGVQKDSVRKRDFTQGKPYQFIIIGLLATLVFIFVLFAVVQLILYLAGV